jgi:mono/diheme cytochrome c family protein
MDPRIGTNIVAMRRGRRLALAAVIVSSGLAAAAFSAGRLRAQAPSAPPISFNREILPILANNCFACHGPDEKKRETKFHFDTQEGMFAKRGVIEPGNAAESLLVEKITDPNPKDRMPPPDSGHSLTERQIVLLRRWIDEGAKWDTHWAYVAPKRPELPAVREAPWVRNPVDQFILARLEREGLRPSPEADKETLLRRVTLDLTGLPPTLAEIDAFLTDSSPDAYEKRVDALLGSPHYGERMAVPWLDAARYADTHGYHIDSLRNMWPWRDWVIGAFNENLPFDRFVIEQLAGDLLPDATREQKIASGFNRNHMVNFEGGAIADEYQVEYVVDRVEATSSAFMGLTMGCARCHSHKFDPITHKEFYEFFAFFNTVPELGLDGRTGNAVPFLPLPSPQQQARLDELNTAIKARETALDDAVVAPLQIQWENAARETPSQADGAGLQAHYELDGNFSDISGRYQHGRTIAGEPTFDGGRVGRAASFDGDTEVSFGNVGSFERDEAFSLAAWLRGRGNLPMAGFQKIESGDRRRGYEWQFDDIVLVDIQKWAARLNIRIASDSPDSAIEVRTRERLRLGDWYHVALTYDGSGKAAGVNFYLDGERLAVDVVRDTLRGSIKTDAPLRVGSKAIGKPYVGQIDDLRLYNRALTPQQVEDLAVHYPIRAILSGVIGKPSKDDANRLREYFLTYRAPEAMRAAHAELGVLRERKEDLVKVIPTAMIMAEMKKPRDTFILARGDYRNQTDKVTPGVPAILPPLPKDAPANRLTLARWLVDPGHPLTSRVAVNRYWQTYFGYGIVKTQEDFGVQGEPPTHPELLDWLATEFIRTGWDVRAMQRLIVTSATYRQSSKTTATLLEKDPENRLLARGPRLRMAAEMVRDTALASSGLLNDTIGGPSVLPYQPRGLWEELAFGDGFSAQAYEQSHGPDLYRRGMYTLWKRTAPPASLATFDAPDREKCTARRAQTNTPLQALVLMNDPTFVEASRALAERALLEGGKDSKSRISYAFRLATARRPSGKEIKVLRTLFDGRYKVFRQDRQAALKLLAVGESRRNRTLDVAELAAYTTVASVIFNLDETITKQ